MSDPKAGLSADVRVRRGDFALAARLSVPPGGVLAVLGPNGSGKSTLLGAIAGTVPLADGEVRVGGRVLSRVGPGTGVPRVDVPVARRRVGLLGQDPLVFPHLSARENVAFGLRAAGVGARDARTAADEWLDRLGLAGLGGRRPDELSGGQRQRVAIARALAAGPDVLLLDEPFAQLDVRVAADLRDTLHEELTATGTPAVLVTHDALDALTLADHALVLDDGAVVEEGVPLTLLDEPRTPFTAALGGLHLVTGTVRGGVLLVRPADGDGVDLALPGTTPDGPTIVTFAPADVRVARPGARPPKGPAVAWRSRVVDLERGPRGVRVRTGADLVADLTAADVAALSLRPGDEVELVLDAARVRVRAA